MSLEAAQRLAHALMFEGYVLYPYRKTSLKNRKRFVFGSLYPAAWARAQGERSGVMLELLARAERVQVEARFLQWVVQSTAPGEQPWTEAVERSVRLGPLELGALASRPEELAFDFPLRAGQLRLADAELAGTLRVSARPRPEGVFHVSVALLNGSTVGAEVSDVEPWSLGAAHLLAHADDGELISLLEPPDALRAAVASCRNDGVWPVLVGEREAPRTLLASPITLYDFPVVAPESSGDYFDATEIDEMLALRVRTMTDAEKIQARDTDARAREIVERSEGLSEAELAALHGAWREPPSALSPGVSPGARARGGSPSTWPSPGERVRLRPHAGRDVLDLALDGEIATVLAAEEDFEGRRYFTVTVDDDPGRDLGELGLPGHRFFFDPDELERLA
jgi:hypothetical protein